MTEAELQIILLSAKVALAAIVFSLPLAFVIAWLLARREFPGKALLQAFVSLPLVIPPVATGFALLLLFGTKGPVGHFLASQFGIVFAFRWTGAALAAGVMAFPLLVRPIRLSLEAVDRKLEEAAATLGAARLTVFLTITLPLTLPGVLAGLPRHSVSLVQPLPLSQTFPVKPKPCRWRSIPCFKARPEMRRLYA